MTFRKGHSGNPAGRPRGRRDRRNRYRDMIAAEGEAIVQKIVRMAKTGDKDALSWCIDRLVPKLRSQDEAVTFRLQSNASLADIGKTVLRAAATAKIPPDDAAKILSALAAQARLIETTQLEERITRIEEAADAEKS